MFYDFARKLQVTFQDPATPIAEGIIDLHHEIFHWLIIIFVPVVVIFVRIVIRSIRVWSDPQTKKNLEKRKVSYAFSGITHGTVLEIIWTITPTIILILIAIPSFGLIYAMDTIIDPDFTIKVIGNQWYWTYDFNYRALLLGDIHDIYASFVPENLTISKKYVIEQTAKLWSHNVKNHLIDSYMLSENMLTKKKGLRLLSVDNPIALPIFTNIRVLITASDVLHSFAIPSFGIKMDATPGRLSAVPLFIERPGTFYGQCSELCGIGHGVMPIEIIGYSSSPYSNFNKSLYFNRDNWVSLAALHDEKSSVLRTSTHCGLVLVWGASLKKKALLSRRLKDDSYIAQTYSVIRSRIQESPHFPAVIQSNPSKFSELSDNKKGVAGTLLLLDIVSLIDDHILDLESEQQRNSEELQATLAHLSHLEKNFEPLYFGDIINAHAIVVRNKNEKQGLAECIAYAHDVVTTKYIKQLITMYF